MVNKLEECRYYLIACGTSDYDFTEDAQLNSVKNDIEQVVEVLTSQFGYEEALTHLRHNPDKETLKIEFAKWLSHRESFRKRSGHFVLFWTRCIIVPTMDIISC